MKKEDVKNAKAFGMTAGMVKVDIARLHQTGTGTGIRFRIGDVIEFPDQEDLEIYSTTFTSKDNKEHEYELIKVAFNNRVRLIPVASFRRDRNGVDSSIEEYGKKSDLCRDLQIAIDDYERISILAGKTIKVVEMFSGRNRRFDNGKVVDYNADDVKTFNTASWPVFELVD